MKDEDLDALIDDGDEKIVSEAERRGLSRAEAVEIGRRLGEETADQMRETGKNREQRVKRAMAYAAWEYDGRPTSSKAQMEEFGVTRTELVGSLERAYERHAPR